MQHNCEVGNLSLGFHIWMWIRDLFASSCFFLLIVWSANKSQTRELTRRGNNAEAHKDKRRNSPLILLPIKRTVDLFTKDPLDVCNSNFWLETTRTLGNNERKEKGGRKTESCRVACHSSRRIAPRAHTRRTQSSRRCVPPQRGIQETTWTLTYYQIASLNRRGTTTPLPRTSSPSNPSNGQIMRSKTPNSS